MKVLYVLNAVAGGASQGIYEAMSAVGPDEFEPFAIAPNGTPEQIARASANFSGFETAPMPWWNLNTEADLPRRAAAALGRWRRSIHHPASLRAVLDTIDRWDIDIVHTGTALTLSGALAARIRNLPHFWHIKECIGWENRVHFPMPDSMLVRLMSAFSARIITMSEYIARPFRAHGCDKVIVVPDGVDPAPFQTESPRTLRERLGIAEDTALVGMVASMTSSWKRHDVYIRMVGELAGRLRNAHFILIGPRPSRKARWPHDGNARYLKNLEKLAERVVPAGRLEFLDHIPDPSDIMRSLDVLVHTCDIEPFGRIAIEAMAAGTPIVGTNTGGIAEQVTDGETGLLVPPGDVAAFAAATARLCEDLELRLRLGGAGRVRVAERFEIRRQVECFLALYTRSVLDSRGTDSAA